MGERTGAGLATKEEQRLTVSHSLPPPATCASGASMVWVRHSTNFGLNSGAELGPAGGVCKDEGWVSS